MNKDITLMLRNKYGKTYFAFTDPDLDLICEPDMPSKTKAFLLRWWATNRGGPLNIGIPYDLSVMGGAANRMTITCLINETNNKENNEDEKATEV